MLRSKFLVLLLLILSLGIRGQEANKIVSKNFDSFLGAIVAGEAGMGERCANTLECFRTSIKASLKGFKVVDEDNHLSLSLVSQVKDRAWGGIYQDVHVMEADLAPNVAYVSYSTSGSSQSLLPIILNKLGAPVGHDCFRLPVWKVGKKGFLTFETFSEFAEGEQTVTFVTEGYKRGILKSKVEDEIFRKEAPFVPDVDTLRKKLTATSSFIRWGEDEYQLWFDFLVREDYFRWRSMITENNKAAPLDETADKKLMELVARKQKELNLAWTSISFGRDRRSSSELATYVGLTFMLNEYPTSLIEERKEVQRVVALTLDLTGLNELANDSAKYLGGLTIDSSIETRYEAVDGNLHFAAKRSKRIFGKPVWYLTINNAPCETDQDW